MSEYSPNIPLPSFEVHKKTANAFPLDSETELLTEEAKYASKLERRHQRLIKLVRAATGRTAIAACLTITTAVGLYNENVHENEAREAAVKVSLETVIKGSSYSAIYADDGFNILNGNYLGESLGPAMRQVDPGDVVAINSGDAPSNPDEVARKIDEDVQTNHRESVSFLGYSLGGRKVLKTAAKFAEESDKPIKIIAVASMPNGLDSLQPAARSQYDTLASVVAPIPDSEHSDAVKFLLTLGMHKDAFAPGDNLGESISHFSAPEFINSWNDSMDIIQKHERPGISTLESQINLAKSNARDDIEKIAHAKSGYMPTLVYLKLKGDQTVNNDKASDEICSYANEFGMPCIVQEVDVQGGGQHGVYGTEQAIAAYTQALSENEAGEAIGISVNNQQYAYAVKNWRMHNSNDDYLSFKKTAPKEPFPNEINAKEDDATTVAEK